ncbi:MAG: cytochrome c [Acidiferrobacterales bacterium]
MQRVKRWLHRAGPSALALLVLLGGAFWLGSSALAHEAEHEAPGVMHAHDMSNVWTIDRGGQLYDNWAKVLFVSLPKTTHPSYPKTGKKKGGATWRCKECHGWDYKGNKGAYGKGSHYTGIKGIRDMVGADPERIHEIIMDDTHRYTERQMPHQAMEMLAMFVSRGQMDMDLYIDRATKKSRGDADRGAAMFQTICAVCHGFNGKKMNFKTPKNPEYIGTVANQNPWEFMHKARMGQPGVGMISLITQSPEAIADILAYAQSLPQK